MVSHTYSFYMLGALVVWNMKFADGVHLLTRLFSFLLVRASSASAIGSTLSLGNFVGSSDETLNADTGTLQVQLQFPTRPHQVHRPERHDEEIGVNRRSNVI